MRDRAGALAYGRAQIKHRDIPADLRAQGHTTWEGMCQAFTRSCWGIGSGFGSAWAQWNGLPAHAKHPGGRPSDAPPGSTLFYKGAGVYGHVMIAEENPDLALSNDLVRTGFIDLVARTRPTTQWGQRYLGWGDNINGVDLPLSTFHQEPTVPKPRPRDLAHEALDKAIAGDGVLHASQRLCRQVVDADADNPAQAEKARLAREELLVVREHLRRAVGHLRDIR